MVEAAEPSRCLVCGGAVVTGQRDGYREAFCRSCGLNYVDPPLRTEEADRIYADEGIVFSSAGRTGVWSRIDRLAADALGSRRSLLDVGAGVGDFLAFMAERGWTPTVGVDLNERVAEIARSRGLDVKTGRIDDVEGAFSLITMMNALEYFNDPFQTLQRALDLLEPGGALVLEMPNTTYHRLQTRLGRRLGIPDSKLMIVAPTPARRLFAFGPRSIDLALRRAGFETVEITWAGSREKGGALERAVRTVIYGVAEVTYALSGRRLLVAPSMLVLARKRAGSAP